MYSRGKYGSLIACWVISILLLIATILMNIFARGVAPEIGLFNKTIDKILDTADIDMVPASWVQWYWVVIATWQCAWMLYFGANICRNGINDEPLIISPTLIPVSVLVLFILTNALNITGLFLWDHDLHIGGLVCMSFMMLFLWIAFVLTCSNISRKLLILEENKLAMEKWYIRIFLQNGLAMYATYCTTAFFIQLNTVVRREDRAVSPRDSTTIFFSILIFFLILYFISDVTFLNRWLRYIFSPYITVLFVLASIIDRNWGARWLRNYRNPAFIASALGVMIIFTVTKFLLTIGRRKISTMKMKNYSDTEVLVENPDP